MASFDDLMEMVDAAAQSLLGGEPIIREATLTKFTPGARTPGAAPASEHACEGIAKAFDVGLIDGTIIRREDRRISLFCSSIPDGVEPKPNDEVTIDGTTYVILAVLGRDAARFMFTVHGRK